MGVVVSRDELAAIVQRERRAGRSLALANGVLRSAARRPRPLPAGSGAGSGSADRGRQRRWRGRDEGARAADPGRRGSRRARGGARAASTTSSSFREPTVAPLLELLRPDVHCKGTDYTADSVPERDDRPRLRRPRRHRRRSQGPFDARPAGADPRDELADRPPRRARRHRPHHPRPWPRCAGPIPTRASTGSSTPATATFAELVLLVDRIIRP